MFYLQVNLFVTLLAMARATPYLDVLNQAFSDEIAKGPPLLPFSPKQFRALFEKLQDHEPIPGVTRTSFTVPFEDGVKTFMFKPSNTPKGAVLPVVFYLHGGAWIAGR
jgi:acetyl esterase